MSSVHTVSKVPNWELRGDKLMDKFIEKNVYFGILPNYFISKYLQVISDIISVPTTNPDREIVYMPIISMCHVQ